MQVKAYVAVGPNGGWLLGPYRRMTPWRRVVSLAPGALAAFWVTVRWIGITAALGWCGSALVIAAYGQPNARRLRHWSLGASAVLITFNTLLGIWSNVALELALVSINFARLRAKPSGASMTDTLATGMLVASQ